VKIRIGWLLLGGMVLAAWLPAQSVADVAKKSKEQSKDKKARVVITDEQLKSVKPAASAGGTVDGGASTAESGGSRTSSSGGTKKSPEEETNDYYQSLFTECIKRVNDQIGKFRSSYAEGLRVARDTDSHELHGSYLQRKATVEDCNRQLQTIATDILVTEKVFEKLHDKARKAGCSKKVMREAEQAFKQAIDPWKKEFLKHKDSFPGMQAGFPDPKK
jgi:hypothetical protein